MESYREFYHYPVINTMGSSPIQKRRCAPLSRAGAKIIMKKTVILLTAVLCFGIFTAVTHGQSPSSPATDTTGEYELLQGIVRQIRQKTDFVPKAALVLGSGLGELGEKLEPVAVIPYSELRNMPVSTAPGHEGRFLFGTLEGVPVVVMQGRVHCYEGYSSLEAVRPIRVMQMLGADTLILTNSSGAINPEYQGGEIMLITDQILFGVQNPLIGANIDELGERFPDMKGCYDPGLLDLAREAAEEAGVALTEGVYLQDTGPSYETPAETKMFRSLGADAVGMSTAIEATAARHMGMKVCGFSCVACAPSDVSQEELSAEVVNSATEQMTDRLSAVLTAFLRRLTVERKQ